MQSTCNISGLLINSIILKLYEFFHLQNLFTGVSQIIVNIAQNLDAKMAESQRYVSERNIVFKT